MGRSFRAVVGSVAGAVSVTGEVELRGMMGRGEEEASESPTAVAARRLVMFAKG